MSKINPLLILLLILLLSGLIYFGFEIKSEMHKRTLAIEKVSRLDLQEKCAKQAKTEFRENQDSKFSGFSNHYSNILNKCFILIETTVISGNIPMNSQSLEDAYEGKIYASYEWINSSNKKYWEVAPITCKITLPSGEEKICKSSDEFDDLTKIYMNAP